MSEADERLPLLDESQGNGGQQGGQGDDVVAPSSPDEQNDRGREYAEDQLLAVGVDASVLFGGQAHDIAGHRIRIVVRRQEGRRVHLEDHRRR